MKWESLGVMTDLKVLSLPHLHGDRIGKKRNLSDEMNKLMS